MILKIIDKYIQAMMAKYFFAKNHYFNDNP